MGQVYRTTRAGDIERSHEIAPRVPTDDEPELRPISPRAFTSLPDIAPVTRDNERPRYSTRPDGRVERCEKVFITPELAMEWIARSGTENRHQLRHKSRAMTALMCEDKFPCNGETIILDWNDDISDGHHRLNSCVAADRGFWSWVVFNSDPALIVTIDQGSTRSKSHILTMRGEKSTPSLAALAKMVWLSETNQLDSHAIKGEHTLGYTVETMFDVLTHHPTLPEHVNVGQRMTKRFSPLGRNLWGFASYVLGRYAPHRIDRFLELMASGIGLVKDDPVLQLRNRLIAFASSKKGHSVRQNIVLTLLIKTWNFYLAGKSVGNLVYREDEAFPKIMGETAPVAKAAKCPFES